MTPDQILGSNLKKLRTRLGYTQDELAMAIGTKRSAYSNYENGTREMPYLLIEKAADFLGCRASTLFDDSNEAMNAVMATAFRIKGLEPGDYEEILRFKSLVRTAISINALTADE